MLMEQIVRAQQGCSEDMEALIEKFKPILKKYSRKLFWEDALNDMTLAFLELIYALPLDKLRSTEDGALVNYIATCVRTTYNAFLKQHFSCPQTVASLDDATEAQKLETIAYEDKREEQQFLDLLDLCPNLTEKERQVLILVYYWGYRSVEIAERFSTSKQNINQIKQRALKKLRTRLAEDGI